MSDLAAAAHDALEALRPIVTEAARLDPIHSFGTIKVADLDRATLAFVDLRRALATKETRDV